MTDWSSEIQVLWHKIVTLSNRFLTKHHVEPNTIFVSNNIYWKFLQIDNDLSVKIKCDVPKRQVMGLDIKILGAEEGSNEMYVGIIEE